MFKIFVSCVLAGCLFNSVYSMGGNMIDVGIWEVKAVSECENPEQYKFQVAVEQRKLNRTHAHFNAWLNFKDVMDSSCGVRIKICKWVDGGCKDYQVLTDENIVDFLYKMAEDNIKAALKLFGILDFPVEQGEYEAEGYLIDYCEFPCKSVLGKFDALTHLLDKDGNEQACILTTVEFREPEGDEELCEKCKE